VYCSDNIEFSNHIGFGLYSSPHVPSDLSLLAFGIPPAREAELAGGMPKVPKGQGLGRLARSAYFYFILDVQKPKRIIASENANTKPYAKVSNRMTRLPRFCFHLPINDIANPASSEEPIRFNNRR